MRAAERTAHGGEQRWTEDVIVRKREVLVPVGICLVYVGNHKAGRLIRILSSILGEPRGHDLQRIVDGIAPKQLILTCQVVVDPELAIVLIVGVADGIVEYRNAIRFLLGCALAVRGGPELQIWSNRRINRGRSHKGWVRN